MKTRIWTKTDNKIRVYIEDVIRKTKNELICNFDILLPSECDENEFSVVLYMKPLNNISDIEYKKTRIEIEKNIQNKILQYLGRDSVVTSKVIEEICD